MTNDEKCGIMRYSVSEISEGMQLFVEGAIDPDSDRRADLLRVYATLPRDERLALIGRYQGMTYAEIARIVRGKSHPETGKRLVARGLARLKEGMNG